MIFSPTLARLAQNGRKTQHRRPIRTDRGGVVKPCPFKVGRDYAIQRAGRSSNTDRRLEVTRVTRARLGDITLREVRAEGHRTTAEFADDWMLDHDNAWPLMQDCTFCDGAGDQDCEQCYRHDPQTGGLVGEHPPGCTPCAACSGTGEELAPVDEQLVLERFESHRATLVWVIEFQISQVPRLLTPAARPAGSIHGYTSNPAHAMRDEPEVLDHFEGGRPYGLRAVDAVPTIDNVSRTARAIATRVRQDSVAAARKADPAAVAAHLSAIQDHLSQIDRLRRDAA